MTSQNIWDDLWGSPEKEEVPIKSSYNSIELARYFQESFIGAEWQSGFGMVNIRALAGALAKWKSHADSATVKSMVDLYMSDAQYRGTNPGWQDFLYHAEQIATSLLNTGENTQPKDKWDLMEEEWEKKYGS